jgi:transcriptional regulator with XRE-family HTH domain
MAKRIQQIRAERGLSQASLAQRAGITRPYLARLETGRQDPRVSVLLRIARALSRGKRRVKVSDLVE